MLQIISTHSRIFHEKPEAPRAGQSFKVKPTKINEFLSGPDWLRNCLYFQQCEADGSIQVVEVKSPAPTVTPPKTPTTIGMPSLPEDAPTGVRINDPVMVDDLTTMSKVKLLEFAKGKFNVQLDGRLAKDDLVRAVAQLMTPPVSQK